jgi:hypothetical protein
MHYKGAISPGALRSIQGARPNGGLVGTLLPQPSLSGKKPWRPYALQGRH